MVACGGVHEVHALCVAWHEKGQPNPSDLFSSVSVGRIVERVSEIVSSWPQANLLSSNPLVHAETSCNVPIVFDTVA